jgi:hypothetical protein
VLGRTTKERARGKPTVVRRAISHSPAGLCAPRAANSARALTPPSQSNQSTGSYVPYPPRDSIGELASRTRRRETATQRLENHLFCPPLPSPLPPPPLPRPPRAQSHWRAERLLSGPCIERRLHPSRDSPKRFCARAKGSKTERARGSPTLHRPPKTTRVLRARPRSLYATEQRPIRAQSGPRRSSPHTQGCSFPRAARPPRPRAARISSAPRAAAGLR